MPETPDAPKTRKFRRSCGCPAGMPCLVDEVIGKDTGQDIVSIVADGDDPLRLQIFDKRYQYLGSGPTFLRVVGAVREWVALNEGVKRKDIPQENWNVDP